jgi:hypothetical protein
VSTVQEIQEAIAKLPEAQRFELIQWLHTQHDWDASSDPEVRASVERGTRQLDNGEGMFLEEVRKLTPTWTTK